MSTERVLAKKRKFYKRNTKSGKADVTRMVRYKQGQLPPLTKERKAELKALADMLEMPGTLGSAVDYSDIPPLAPELCRGSLANTYECYFACSHDARAP